MADYICRARSSYFRTTDREKLQELVDKVGAELWTCTVDEVEHCAFGNYNGITEYWDDESNETIDITPLLQQLIPDDETIVLQEVGHEKLRYVSAWAVIITKHNIEVLDFETKVLERALEISGKEHIQLTY